jgi:hypothetical protein
MNLNIDIDIDLESYLEVCSSKVTSKSHNIIVLVLLLYGRFLLVLVRMDIYE